jgi:hypothetical protein
MPRELRARLIVCLLDPGMDAGWNHPKPHSVQRLNLAETQGFEPWIRL